MRWGSPPGVEAFAAELRAAGHTVHVPDLYAGRTFSTLPDGVAHAREIGFGAVMDRGVAAVEGLGWPAGVPVQVHGMEADPSFADEGDLDAARALVASTAEAELFLYPGKGHLFADPSLPSYEAAAAALLTRRVLEFLAALR